MEQEAEGHSTSLDPYAKRFVPDSLTSINYLNGHQIDTPPLQRFNFEQYIARHVGVEFLPAIPLPLDVEVTENFILVDNLFLSAVSSAAP